MADHTITSVEPANLGPQKAEYKVHQAKNRANLFFGRLFIVAGPLLLLYSLYRTVAAGAGGLNYLCGGLGLLLLLGGVYALWEHRRDTGLSVQVHRDGLVYRRGGKTEIAPWDQIAEARMSVADIKSSNGNTTLDRVYNYRLTLRTGNEVNFNFNKNSIRNIDELSTTIQHEVTQRLLPTARETFNSGGTVRFGKLSVDHLGISNGQETVAWTEVEEIKVEDGTITVRQKGKWLKWANISVGELPNIFVFLALVENYLERPPDVSGTARV